MTAYGPTKKERNHFIQDVIAIGMGSFSGGGALFTIAIPGAIVLLFVASAVLALGVWGLFEDVNRLALRIRIEESKAKSALIDEITAIYRGAQP